MKKQTITELLIFIAATELVGALSGILAGNSFSFYRELITPPFSPPDWLFPLLWTLLYALMGISAFILYSSHAKEKCKGLIVYGTQLFVNFMWSIIFFRFKLFGLSVAVILTLLAFVIAMIIVFYKIRPTAAYLNIPYLLWIIFASYLNIGILYFN